MSHAVSPVQLRLDPQKFKDPDFTAKGERRAVVALSHLQVLWFNTGSLCNLQCHNCYMESSPENDSLLYISEAEVRDFLDEIRDCGLDVREIGFTGGEPFMNPQFPAILRLTLERGFKVLVLTNATKPLANRRGALGGLSAELRARLTFRVSIDHPDPNRHDQLRGDGAWEKGVDGLAWLVAEGFDVAVAGRTCWDDDEMLLRGEYGAMFAARGIELDANDPTQLVMFPEMDENADVPEITVSCWSILGVEPETMMCATSRMVVKRKGADRPVVTPCTLLPYDAAFDVGGTLAEADTPIKLNHPHCARFCVLGGASCSA